VVADGEEGEQMSYDITYWMTKGLATSRAKGWWPSLDRTDVLKRVPEQLALIHSEVSEALECYRVDDMEPRSKDGKPEGFGSELADVVIRTLNLAAALGIDLEAEVKAKSEFNETRPFRHGGKVV
jgi:NTP pyrophosphatase (non-canonical NTP hydrolase)